MSKSIEELKAQATQIRRDILRMVHAVNSGHPGGSLGCVEYFTALYGKVMNYKLPFSMEGKAKIISTFLTVTFLPFSILH